MEKVMVPRCSFGLGPAGLRGKPDHQALADEPALRAWLQRGAPGFLRAGSHLSHLGCSWVFFDFLSGFTPIAIYP